MRRIRNAVLEWLRAAPVADPVDRRNAPFVQVLLVFFVLFVLLNKALYLWVVFNGQWQATRNWMHDASTGALMCVMAGVALWMIRRGHFRWAVSLFLATVMVVMVVIYAVIDVGNMSMQVFPLLVLALGGLVLGRRALRIIVVVQVAIYLLCLASNLMGFAPGRESLFVAVGIFLATTGSYLLMAFIVDRAASTLRGSLAEAQAKTRELEQEMIERERAQEQLVHAQKMEVVGRAASGLVHDFGNVLGVILGYATRAERLADSGVSAMLEAMDGIRVAAEKALCISRNLLSFGRQDAEHMEVLDVGEVLAGVKPMLQQVFGSRVCLYMEPPDEPLQVIIDSSRMELVLLSMASNACDAMPEGGSFSVGVSRTGTGTLVMTVEDTGSGIAPQHLEHVFEPFYTTKSAENGTGLGLSMARDVILRAGGDITVCSTRGKGTTFFVNLPLANRIQLADVSTAKT